MNLYMYYTLKDDISRNICFMNGYRCSMSQVGLRMLGQDSRLFKRAIEDHQKQKLRRIES